MLVVLTQARGASGEAGSLRLHRLGPLGWDGGAGITVPGVVPASPLWVAPTGDEVWFSTLQSVKGGVVRQVAAGLAPLECQPIPLLAGPKEHLRSTGYALLDGSGGGVVLSAPGESALFSVPRGALAEGPYAREAQRHPMAGPVLSALVSGNARLLALEQDGNALRLAVYDRLGATERLSATLSPVPDAVGTVALAASEDGSVVAAAVAPKALAPGQPERSSVWVFPAESALSAPAAKLEALGSLTGAQSLHFSGDATLWSATRIEDSHFGYLTQWCLLQDQGHSAWTKSAEHILPEFPAQALVAPTGPPLDGLVVASREVLTLWTGAGAFWSQTLPGTIGAVMVDGSSVFAGADNQIVELDLNTGETLAAHALDSGHVVSMARADLTMLRQVDVDADGLSDAREVELGLDPAVEDSDGDGVVDGLDTDPLMPSAQLSLPDALVFSGRAAGQEVRALLPRDVRGREVRWHAAFDEAQLPWLRMYPHEGQSGTPLYLAVDPVEARRGMLPTGTISIEVFDVELGVEAVGSPAIIPVAVSSNPGVARKVLWLLPANGTPNAGQRLRGYLGGAPLFLSQQVHRGPFSEGLDEVNLVAMTSESAAQGGLSQRAALDFLSGGGALLLLAEGSGAEQAYLGHWGAPLGLRIGPGGGLKLDEASSFDAATGMDVTVKEVGMGRLALADASVLSDNPRPEMLRSMRALFAWLCDAGRQLADFDGDALPNSLEDLNGNGVADPGETDRMLVDSDGDGLPDGLEDRNANGRLDAGETDPRSADSDDDGVRDGADASPAPAAGTPVVERVEPAEAPAEGRVEVRVVGRDLPQQGSYRIGAQQASIVEWEGPESVRLMLPDMGPDEGGAVDVRVAESNGARGAILERGFRYLPRSRVALSMEGAAQRETGSAVSLERFK